LQQQDCNNIMPIKIGSRVVMKAKAAIKGTVLEATAKYVWAIKWDDGIARSPYKSQQLKESATDAPPAALNAAITHGKCDIFLWLVVEDLSSPHVLVFSSKAMKEAIQPP
jgi:hypothetical protein